MFTECTIFLPFLKAHTLGHCHQFSSFSQIHTFSTSSHFHADEIIFFVHCSINRKQKSHRIYNLLQCFCCIFVRGSAHLGWTRRQTVVTLILLWQPAGTETYSHNSSLDDGWMPRKRIKQRQRKRQRIREINTKKASGTQVITGIHKAWNQTTTRIQRGADTGSRLHVR